MKRIKFRNNYLIKTLILLGIFINFLNHGTITTKYGTVSTKYEVININYDTVDTDYDTDTSSQLADKNNKNQIFKVAKVIDGDTINVLNGDQQLKIRLYGIDAPEKEQAYGQKATYHLKSLVGSSVKIKVLYTDQYGRSVALIYDLTGNNINRSMVADGFAWVYRTYCKESFCSDWYELESFAKTKKSGLWSTKNPTPPWIWRKNNR